ncbi:ABC transporter ATP-binding protein [Flocculibacter collagenilyticus]|uniref:ABC transporter ATP-binding protein n=1 Tax=Flocculibacter collagenilyticus TaxID=2744479 RepID=UPI0018F3FD87|nr:ATP-binding cassette domain-containing protein [Flocculibacter collagenilyticus]
MIAVKALKKGFKKSSDKENNMDPRMEGDMFWSVKNVSFECNKGEVLGLLGPNGAGKTTTLRMLSTALQPHEGSIEINGVDVVSKPILARKKIGFLSGSTGLYGKLTVDENIRYFAKLHGMKKEKINERIKALYDLLEMHSFANRKAEQLSTGMTQKASIARAVIHEPEVVILDEPTTGLDIMTTETLLSFIESLKALNIPVIFSTHHLGEVERLCDRVAVINEGESCFSGTLAEFKALSENHVISEAFMSLIHDKAHNISDEISSSEQNIEMEKAVVGENA